MNHGKTVEKQLIQIMFSNTWLTTQVWMECMFLLGLGIFTYFEHSVEAWGFWIRNVEGCIVFLSVLWFHCCMIGARTQDCIQTSAQILCTHSSSALPILSEWLCIHRFTLCPLDPLTPVMEPRARTCWTSALSLAASLGPAKLNLVFFENFIDISTVFV